MDPPEPRLDRPCPYCRETGGLLVPGVRCTNCGGTQKVCLMCGRQAEIEWDIDGCKSEFHPCNRGTT